MPPATNRKFSQWLGSLVILIFAVIAGWIGFGSGVGNCSGSISFVGFTATHGGGAECRVVFGFGAVLIWIFLALTLWEMWGGKKNRS